VLASHEGAPPALILVIAVVEGLMIGIILVAMFEWRE
jgi:hypothetical protein